MGAGSAFWGTVSAPSLFHQSKAIVKGRVRWVQFRHVVNSEMLSTMLSIILSGSLIDDGRGHKIKKFSMN